MMVTVETKDVCPGFEPVKDVHRKSLEYKQQLEYRIEKRTKRDGKIDG